MEGSAGPYCTKLTKTVLINYPRSYRDPIPGVLHLAKENADSMVMTSLMNPVSSYKYLGVILDPKLHWTLQHKSQESGRGHFILGLSHWSAIQISEWTVHHWYQTAL